MLGHAEHVLHPHRRRRPVGGVVDRHLPTARAASRPPAPACRARRRAATAAAPAAASPTSSRCRSPRPVAPDEVRPQPRVERGEQRPVGEVGPRRSVAAASSRAGTRRAPAAARPRVTSRARPASSPAPGRRGVDGVVAGVGRTRPPRRAPGRRAAARCAARGRRGSLSQTQPTALDDIVEHAGDVGRLDRAPPGGCGRRSRRPSRSAATTNRPAPADRRRRATPSSRCAAGTGRGAAAPPAGPGTRRAAGGRRRRGRPSSRSNRIPARRARSAARSREPPQRAAVGAFVVDVPGDESDAQAEVGGKLADPPAQTRRARRRRRRRRTPSSTVPSATMRASRGCSGRSTIRRPTSVSRPSSSTAPSVRSSASASLPRPRRRWFGERAARSTGVPQAATSRARPARSTRGDLGGAVGGRLPCSICDHSR